MNDPDRFDRRSCGRSAPRRIAELFSEFGFVVKSFKPNVLRVNSARNPPSYGGRSIAYNRWIEYTHSYRCDPCDRQLGWMPNRLARGIDGGIY